MIVENIRRLCAKHNITFRALERKLDIGNGAIARWSKASPSVKNVQKVAEFFNVTVDELLK